MQRERIHRVTGVIGGTDGGCESPQGRGSRSTGSRGRRPARPVGAYRQGLRVGRDPAAALRRTRGTAAASGVEEGVEGGGGRVWDYAGGMSLRGDVQAPAVPDDVDAAGIEKASGLIQLPLHIAWSDPERRYDLADRRSRARVYEQVLREGDNDDVRRFIDVEQLLDMWDELFVPRRVRAAWAEWFLVRRGLRVWH